MHDPQHNQRIAASRAFMESLDQLQNILAQERQIAESQSQELGSRSAKSWLDSQDLEEAAADLDAFFGDEDLWADGGWGDEE